MTHAQNQWELNFDSAPFCNGSLHLGHVRNYVLGDVRARWLRRHGVDVTYLSAFDAFGLPNEEGAREAGIQPDIYVAQQAERISKQLRALGLSYSPFPFATVLRSCVLQVDTVALSEAPGNGVDLSEGAAHPILPGLRLISGEYSDPE